ncbi:hypothetical protein HID58_018343 [Brassica napus]|uniref:Uncharacterized protein n=1 Tax=Brassica napus TaxID=3708 RepID=A0ABQ8D9Q2_BRANA|nr:hypothetical protein HID58_018343 [Brassica napus]
MHGKLLSESANLCAECSDREVRSVIGLGFCSCCEKRLGTEIPEAKPRVP